MKKIKYSLTQYPFEEIIKNLFNCSDLSMIHTQWKSDYDLFTDVRTDTHTEFHKHFYNNITDTNFYSVYTKFMKEQVQPLFNEPIIYQKIPSFRVQLPSNVGVAQFHKDRDYQHSTHEINFFIPITNAIGNNTIWVESEEDKADYAPMNTFIGEFVKWDGANLKHGNKINDTGNTRVSFDFRVMPMSKYEDNDRESVSVNTKMKIGEYWKSL
jgi:hypothetical protein